MAALSGFSGRHIGVDETDLAAMLAVIGAGSLDELIRQTVPAGIRLTEPLRLPEAASEEAALAELKVKLRQNLLFKNWIGAGYSGTHTPAVILRNILENPGWYTAYTPYQAEISQGRLEALLNFQTMVCDLTGMDIANASLLDEATAAAEAMTFCHGIKAGTKFFAAPNLHPQTRALLETRAEPLGIEIVSGDPESFDFSTVFGALLQYPATDGLVTDLSALVAKIHAVGAQVVVASDLLALTLLKPPGEWGVDAVVGSAQRFGVPLGYGGPHAGFLAVKDANKRRLPGRLVGVSKDSAGQPAYRLTLQTREQHIRREKATSNICTAQVLLAVMASMYAVYHGPAGLRAIARRVNALTTRLAAGLSHLKLSHTAFFDTIAVEVPDALSYLAEAASRKINLRHFADGRIGISLDETTTEADVAALVEIFGGTPGPAADSIPAGLRRESDFLTHPVFNRYHTETEMMRYLRRLEAKDLSLTTSMIPLGSCTMKLNAAAEMLPVTWAHTGALHPFAPASQTAGYDELFTELEGWLSEITGFAGTSVQPNAGSQGEYAGLLVIRKYHESLGESHRDICLIPTSAHGTNPASAAMAGYRVVAVKCDASGNIDLSDLRAKIDEHRERVGVLMITYPSTHGVFEDTVKEVCALVHGAGGQVYMDGANMNAQVGLCSPGHIGADVCHLNLHKTFCIPHGGGGPGVGPVCVAKHLAPFLPGHPLREVGGRDAIGAISAAPWGSASICVIPWMYIRMMGAAGLKSATEYAILNANYIAGRLSDYFPVLYAGANGRVAHECILDFREWKTRAGIEVEDIAKRLIDFGFHAPTMSWPVPGTLMIEPTESESKAELDRFCDALIAIHGELLAIETGTFPREDNPLVNSPHTAAVVTATEWPHAYSREQAAYPAPWLREHKFWPSVGRIDNVYGDRNIFCSCVPVEEAAV